MNLQDSQDCETSVDSGGLPGWVVPQHGELTLSLGLTPITWLSSSLRPCFALGSYFCCQLALSPAPVLLCFKTPAYGGFCSCPTGARGGLSFAHRPAQSFLLPSVLCASCLLELACSLQLKCWRGRPAGPALSDQNLRDPRACV